MRNEPERQTIAFRWPVPKAGVRLARRRKVDYQRGTLGDWEDVLAEVEPYDRAARDLYDPLACPELLGMLAALPPDNPRAWAVFAGERGLLTPVVSASRVVGDGLPAAGQLSFAEPVELWRKELRRLREAVVLLGAIQARDLAALRACIQLSGEGVKYETSDGDRWRTVWVGGAGSPLAPIIRKGGILAAGWCVFQEMVNSRLDVRRQLLWADFKTLRRFEVPTSLLGVAWMQLADGADGHLQVRRCPARVVRPECLQSFVVRPTARRKHDIYCSDPCKMAFWRREQKAHAMQAKGATPASIAKATGVDTKTVRAWLAKARAKGGK